MSGRSVPDALRDDHNLVVALEAAVPFRILELLDMPVDIRAEHVRWWASDAAEAIACRGDVLMFGSKKSGRAAEVFNHLAKGIAVGALQPGGITFAGRHWEVEEPDRVPAAAKLKRTVARRPVAVVDLPAEVPDARH